jgi:hypothetical protein
MDIDKYELFKFVQEQSAVFDVEIIMETDLQDDLVVYGDDAVTTMIGISLMIWLRIYLLL